MSQWLEQVIERANGVADYLTPVREKALARLQQDGWPKNRNEAWIFTPLTAIKEREIVQVATPGDYTLPVVEALDSLDIVFVDGILVSQPNAESLPAGLTISTLDAADSAQQAQIAALFGTVKPTRHLFGLVNDALCQQGVYVRVASGYHIDRPVRIVNLVTQNVDAHTRLLVEMEAGSSATFIEHGSGNAQSMTTAFAEYSVGSGAKLEHYRFVMFTGQAKHTGGCHFTMLSESALNSTLIGYGSELSRIDVDIIHSGEHVNAKMNAVYLVAEGELFDLHSTIEHAVPNGTTEENARGIVGDRGKAVFNGRIHIHRNAQKTLAQLNNRNLLLSRRGVINTKPELEIYADDVQCAHGATVAEIEEAALYYLLSRGISRSKALVMLNFGFIQELVNAMPNEALRNWLLPLLSQRFESMEVK